MARKPSGITQKNTFLRSLVDRVLSKLGYQFLPETDQEVVDLQVKIAEALKHDPSYNIGESTLKRLLDREAYKKSFDVASTLNPLARLAGYESWGFYLQEMGKPGSMLLDKDAEQFFPPDIIDDAEMLKPGAIFRMGWYPTRYMDLQYLGDCEFKVIKYLGTGADRTGEIITARWFEVVEIPEHEQVNGISEDIAGILGGEIVERAYL